MNTLRHNQGLPQTAILGQSFVDETNIKAKIKKNADTEAKVPTLHRKISLTAGLLYLLTFVSIPTLAMYSTVKGANFLVNGSSSTSAIISGILEIVVALAGIGTAVVLFPMLKKQNESAALALVAARILESGAIFIGVACLSTIVAMKHAG